jgi:two-component system, NarL family, sensor kinase
MRMRIGALVGDGSLAPSVGVALIDCEKIATDAIEELGSLSQILYPPLLEDSLGLAIRGYVCRLARINGIHVSIEISKNLERLLAPFERVLFRIVQECLTNIDRHSGSRWARICLERERGAVSLLVEDYGKGLSNHQDRDPDANRWNFGIPVR